MPIIRIALDAMGGDHGPSVVVPAALRMVEKHSDLELILVGIPEKIQKYLKNHHYPNSRLSIYPASQEIGMDESPTTALRSKKDASMRVAVNLVKDNKAQACVSAGNTGALVAIARFVLKTLPGIDKPALCGLIPSKTNQLIRFLDVGAIVDAKPEHLLQFSLMATILSNLVDKIPNPKVSLLNIGHEDIKGNELVKQTSVLLQNNAALNYAGYIEADEIFHGKTDIVVCDGFVGNVALKSAEGIAKLILFFIKRAFNKNLLTKFIGLLCLPILKSLHKEIDPARYNGASLIGLKGIVVKSHGSASILGFARAIEQARLQAQSNFLEEITTL